MSVISGVKVWEDGSFVARVPRPVEEGVALKGAIRMLQAEADEEWGNLRSALPHRSEVRPGRMEREERLQQDRSLGWRTRETDQNLWPMSGERYMRALIGNFMALRGHLAEMDAEMAARPEEYQGRGFDLVLWQSCAQRIMLADELALVGFIVWVAAPNSKAGGNARDAVLRGLMLWSNRSRQQLGTWMMHPFFPDLD